MFDLDLAAKLLMMLALPGHSCPYFLLLLEQFFLFGQSLLQLCYLLFGLFYPPELGADLELESARFNGWSVVQKLPVHRILIVLSYNCSEQPCQFESHLLLVVTLWA